MIPAKGNVCKYKNAKGAEVWKATLTATNMTFEATEQKRMKDAVALCNLAAKKLGWKISYWTNGCCTDGCGE